MINVTELVRGPKTKEEPKTLLKDAQVRSVLMQRIGRVAEQVLSRIRIEGDRYLFPIFSVSGDSPETDLDSKGIRGIVENERVQRLALNVMLKFGFDPNVSEPGERGNKYVHPNLDYPDGFSIRTATFPSSTIDGLDFIRETRYYTGNKKVFEETWSVKDNAPNFRIHLRDPKKRFHERILFQAS